MQKGDKSGVISMCCLFGLEPGFDVFGKAIVERCDEELINACYDYSKVVMKEIEDYIIEHDLYYKDDVLANREIRRQNEIVCENLKNDIAIKIKLLSKNNISKSNKNK